MERLTNTAWRNFDPWECCGQDNFCTRGCHEKGGCNNGCIVPKLYGRLAAYEDTGLEPEEIKEHEEAKYNAGYYHGDEDRCRWIEKELGPIEHLRDLLQAEKDGRLVVLPCKTGDKVLVDARTPPYNYLHPADGCGSFAKCEIVAIVTTKKETYLKLRALYPSRAGRRDYLKYGVTAIGKTVFLTRDEAEEALAEKISAVADTPEEPAEPEWKGRVMRTFLGGR